MARQHGHDPMLLVVNPEEFAHALLTYDIAAKILRQTEDFVLTRGGIIVRLAGIYGPGRSALLRKFLGGTATIDPAARFLNHIHRDDAAAALLLLTQRRVDEEQTESIGASPIYNVSDNHPLLQREAYEWLAAHFDQPLPALRVAQEMRKRGNSNKRVSSRKLHATGWTPKYPTFETAMRESILPGWRQGVV
jgi:nucleoside-diphosphate-sugar epimerase